MARLKIKTIEPVLLRNTEKAKTELTKLQNLLEMFKNRLEIDDGDDLSFRLDLLINATYERVQEILVALRLLTRYAKTAQKIVIIVDAKNSTMWVGPPAAIIKAQKDENYKVAMEAVVRLTKSQKVKLLADLNLAKL